MAEYKGKGFFGWYRDGKCAIVFCRYPPGFAQDHYRYIADAIFVFINNTAAYRSRFVLSKKKNGLK